METASGPLLSDVFNYELWMMKENEHPPRSYKYDSSSLDGKTDSTVQFTDPLCENYYNMNVMDDKKRKFREDSKSRNCRPHLLCNVFNYELGMMKENCHTDKKKCTIDPMGSSSMKENVAPIPSCKFRQAISPISGSEVSSQSEILLSNVCRFKEPPTCTPVQRSPLSCLSTNHNCPVNRKRSIVESISPSSPLSTLSTVSKTIPSRSLKTVRVPEKIVGIGQNLDFEMKDFKETSHNNFEDIEFSTILHMDVPDVDCPSDHENEENVNWGSYETQINAEEAAQLQTTSNLLKLLLKEVIAMSFCRFDRFDDLNDSKYEWRIRVRAQAIWKGITRESKEFRGFNIIFIDDTNCRIHAYIAAQLAPKYQHLKEGQIYILQNFSVKYYNGDETSRAIRSDKHIYFTQDTNLTEDTDGGLEIEAQSFDLFLLSDVEKLKKDNRFLIDVVGVLEDGPQKISYKKDEVEKHNVKFTITDGRTSVNVTFFNEFGDSFMTAMNQKLEPPVIIVIAFAKINEWNDEVCLTNYPATRFYLNSTHPSVKELKRREKDSDFYIIDLDDEDEFEIPLISIKELLMLKEDYVQKEVQCKVTVKKIDQKMSWYYKLCTGCEKEFDFHDENNQCSKCKKIIPYPDRRFRLYTLCSDSSGTVPIVLQNEEVMKLCGKTVYDLEVDENQVGDGDKFPPILKELEKKMYNITICLTEDNVKKGSNVYNASKISDPEEMSATHSPFFKSSVELQPTEMSSGTLTSNNSPPTGNSSNKTRARKINEALDCELPKHTPLARKKNVKLENVMLRWSVRNLTPFGIQFRIK
ncbi:hypothetical protein POM88_024490 [Heracleum sosnowskyi]|uniref:Replication factor A C-terminal domain-containing protein n=1 Tax=Heracleum sosnowskyi TaxID=360622 RepID=A0AAD8MLH7_9APIA|nr:hypothetical protein POM88_024490 [Heracleum sosnowskyi]